MFYVIWVPILVYSTPMVAVAIFTSTHLPCACSAMTPCGRYCEHRMAMQHGCMYICLHHHVTVAILGIAHSPYYCFHYGRVSASVLQSYSPLHITEWWLMFPCWHTCHVLVLTIVPHRYGDRYGDRFTITYWVVAIVALMLVAGQLWSPAWPDIANVEMQHCPCCRGFLRQLFKCLSLHMLHCLYDIGQCVGSGLPMLTTASMWKPLGMLYNTTLMSCSKINRSPLPSYHGVAHHFCVMEHVLHNSILHECHCMHANCMHSFMPHSSRLHTSMGLQAMYTCLICHSWLD